MIKIFNNDEFGQIRSIEKDGELWFIGKDIAEALGYLNTRDAINNHVDNDDKANVVIHDGSQNRNMVTINESGIYSLILCSKLPQAKKFKRWVTSEVIPSIRKHGLYAKDELLDNPDLLIEVASKLKEERALRLKAEEEKKKLIHDSKVYTTSELAKELGLKSANQLNAMLATSKIQYKQNKTWLLYSKYADMGLCSIKQSVLDSGKVVYDRKWTGKGRDFILNLF